MDFALAKIEALATTPYPARFVLHSGDAVLRGANGAMWNVSFTPIIERLSRRAGLPFFFAAGNHDVSGMPVGDPGRAPGLRNTLTAMSKLMPPEGSKRRLAGYPTYAVGYGNLFTITLDSNIASDPTQLAWVTDQLDHLDRNRYRHIVAFTIRCSRQVHTRAPRTSALDGRHRDFMHAALPPASRRVDHRRPRSSARSLGRALRRQERQTVPHHQVITGGGGAPIYVYASRPTCAVI